jgi:hypothetical protein
MLQVSSEKKIHYTLRLAAGMCFIGHGAFGVVTKSIWVNYFAVFGIGHDLAYQLMPWIGTVDIFMGLSMLIFPTRAIAAWLVIWGFITASLRPLSGEPFAEFIERAGNYGAPLAFLLLSGFSFTKKIGWFAQINPDTTGDTETFKRMIFCLKIVVFLLLLGHGWLNLIEKKALLDQYASLGFSNTHEVAQAVGIFEIIAACTTLIRPIRPLIFLLLLWKITSELFYPKYELFEWIERGGSYCSLLALWLALPSTSFVVGHTIKIKYLNFKRN